MKSRAIKGVMLTVCLILVMSLLVGCAGGCTNTDEEIKADGFFQYIIVTEYDRVPTKNNEPVVAIVGFTASGMDQEVIEIPREIGGKTVRYIGYRDEGFWHNNSRHVHCSENLRKIYVHDNIEIIVHFDGSQVDMMFCSNSLNIIFDGGVLFKKIYIYKSVFDGANYSSDISAANIVFMNNYSDEVNGGYYRLDNIESGEKIPVPPSPVRSGYEFTGWYTESDCINAWNFDMSPTILDETEFRLYAGWQAK